MKKKILLIASFIASIESFAADVNLSCKSSNGEISIIIIHNNQNLSGKVSYSNCSYGVKLTSDSIDSNQQRSPNKIIIDKNKIFCRNQQSLNSDERISRVFLIEVNRNTGEYWEEVYDSFNWPYMVEKYPEQAKIIASESVVGLPDPSKKYSKHLYKASGFCEKNIGKKF